MNLKPANSLAMVAEADIRDEVDKQTTIPNERCRCRFAAIDFAVDTAMTILCFAEFPSCSVAPKMIKIV